MFVDTTFCVDLLREARHGAGPATACLRSLGDTPLFASVFVLCELHAGAGLSVHPKRTLQQVERLVGNLTVVYPDVLFPVAYAELEVAMRRKGTPIPAMDLLIAATARMQGLPLLTRDSAHYRRVPGLVVETY